LTSFRAPSERIRNELESIMLEAVSCGDLALFDRASEELKMTHI
jgi:hypothetical protein